MNINDIVREIKAHSDDLVIVHDMLLPITSTTLYRIMSNPLNWQIVNFPIIKKVEIIDNTTKTEIQFYLYEKLFGKYYKSEIMLNFFDDQKTIEYSHTDVKFPFVNKMASNWYFIDESEKQCHFYIIRRFRIKNKLTKIFLFWFIKRAINKHVATYYEQLINLTKAISLITI